MEQSPQLIALENQKLRQVLNVSSVISSSLELNVVLDSIMEKARELMDAEASSLMLVDESTDELYFHVIKGEKSDVIKQIRLKLGEGIAGWVAEHGEPVLLEDCSDDPRFSNRADNLSSFVTRSMISVPLKFKGRVLGTVQVLNKKDNQLFTKHDLMIFSALAGQAAIALENARLHRMATIDGMTGL